MAVVGSASLLLTMVVGPSFAESTMGDPGDGDATGVSTDQADSKTPIEDTTTADTTSGAAVGESDGPPADKKPAPTTPPAEVKKEEPKPAETKLAPATKQEQKKAAKAVAPVEPAKESSEPAPEPDSTGAVDAAQDEPEAEVASLRWTVTAADGSNPADTTFMIQGPSDADVKNDDLWTAAFTSLVVDNTGEADYKGLDENPKPGEFEVPKLESETDPAVTEDVVVDETYRVRPTVAPEGVEVGEDAQWLGTKGALEPVDPAAKPDAYELTTPDSEQTLGTDELPAKPGAQTLDVVEPDAQSLDAGIMPLVVGSPDGAVAPYLYWTVKDANNAPVGGATFNLAGPGPANWWNSWPTAVLVVDNTGQPGYVGLDRDTDPGEFLVTHLGTSPSAGNAVNGTKNYRVQQSGVPSGGYTWTNSTNWIAINGNNANATWSNSTAPQTHNFGNFPVNTSEITWEVKAGADLIGGATFTIQGPRNSTSGQDTNDNRWNSNTATVSDCIAGPCGGPDLDPAPGKFKVKKIGTQDVRSDRRYRVQWATPPATYKFTNPQAWNFIAGSGQSPAANTWSSGKYNFGAYQVEELSASAPKCDAGYVYSILQNGQMRQYSPVTDTVTDFGSKMSSASSANGLGIGAYGSVAYAYERSGTSQMPSTTATIYKYDPTTNSWSATGASRTDNDIQFVAGGVNLANGKYYFGGFQSINESGTANDQTRFKLYEYDPATNAIVYRGYILVAKKTFNGNNGDLAFNSAGDLFVVHGTGSDVRIASVTAVNLAAAPNGTEIQASVTDPRDSGMTKVNGIAFDSSGKGFLGDGSTVRSFSVPDWLNGSTVTTGLASGSTSTDLSTCSSPPTFTLYKNVVGGRVDPAHQFKLSFKSGSTQIGSATTTGAAAGRQAVSVGPFPVSPGATITFTEDFVGTGNSASQYASRWVCRKGDELLSSGVTATGSIVFPVGVPAVSCEFFNAPLIANVTLRKAVIPDGQTQSAPRAGWPVGVAVPSNGTSIAPGTLTLPTESDGSVSWALKFPTESATTGLTVHEEVTNPDYEFKELECTVTSLGLDAVTSTYESASQLLEGIKPGDTVDCTFTNNQLPPLGTTTLVLNKDVVDGRVSTNDQFELTVSQGGTSKGTATTTGTATGIQSQAVNVPATSLTPGATYTLTETASGMADLTKYISALTCVSDDSDYPVVAKNVDANGQSGSITLPKPARGVNVKVTCTFTNSPLGKIVVQKVDAEATSTTLAGAVFEFWFDKNGNGVLDSSPTDTLVDTAAPTLANGLAEKSGLAWGTYFVKEITAPAGYELSASSPQKIVLGQANSGIGQLTFENPRKLSSVSWSKFETGNTNKFLAGSEWKIANTVTGVETAIKDCTSAVCDPAFKDTNSTAGQFTVGSLPWGTYTLTETTAPPGYKLDPTAHSFTIDATHLTVTVGSFPNDLVTPPTIPLTGGLGRDFFTILGFGILVLAAGAFGVMQYRTRRQEV